MKFGYMGGFSNPSQAYYNFTPFVQYRFSGGVPNQLTQTAQFGGTGPSAVEFVRNLVPTSFYAQDQWTSEPADAAGRRALRLHPHQLSRLLHGRTRLSADADADLLPGPLDRRACTGTT